MSAEKSALFGRVRSIGRVLAGGLTLFVEIDDADGIVEDVGCADDGGRLCVFVDEEDLYLPEALLEAVRVAVLEPMRVLALAKP